MKSDPFALREQADVYAYGCVGALKSLLRHDVVQSEVATNILREFDHICALIENEQRAA